MSDTLAEKLTVRSIFEISAKSVSEFGSLMIEIRKKQEQFPQFAMDIAVEWETMDIHIGPVDGNDKRQLKVKNLPSDRWDMFVNRVLHIENQIITYLNEGRSEGEEVITPVFSCNAKLKMEMKDKDAQKALELPEQLSLFAPVGDMADSYLRQKSLIIENNELYEKLRSLTNDTVDSEDKKYFEDCKEFIDGLRPDGENIESVTFTAINKDGTKGREVELKAK